MSRIRELLAKIGLYRLTAILLLIVVAYSFVAAFIGWLDFDPLAMLVTLLILVSVTTLLSWVFGNTLVGSVNPESPMITGMILFLILRPTLDGEELIWIGAAAVLAAISKFLIVWRARHIFNPVAISVSILTLFNLYPAAWWVANPYMLPVVAVVGLILWWRMARMRSTLLFWVAYFGGLAAAYYYLGASIQEALQIALYSSPIAFIASFMIIEPLTAAPRGKQRALLNLIAGLAMSLPLWLGEYMWWLSPEVVIVAVNLLAFLVSGRVGISLTLTRRVEVANSIFEYHFSPKRALKYQSGQFLELQLNHAADIRGNRRMFSLSSSPESSEISIAMRHEQPSSTFKLALAELQPGAEVVATGIAGDFIIPKSEPQLFIAAGVGITPFLSVLRGSDSARNVVLLYMVRSASEIAWADVLADAKITVLLRCPENPGNLPPSWRWIGNPPLTKAILRGNITDINKRRAYISGSSEMLRIVRKALRGTGVKGVKSDVFLGY